MYCAGGTLGTARKPFIQTAFQKRTMMARPYTESLPGGSGYNLLKEKWASDFFKDIEKLALKFIYYGISYKYQRDKLLQSIFESKKTIPSDLRICGTFFTQLSLVGDMTFESVGQEITPHIDGDDIFTAIIHFGTPITGGNLQLFSGNSKTNIGSLVKTHKFLNGNIHMGCFTDVVHSVSRWTGVRGSFSLNLKKSMLNFFEDVNRRSYYKTYKQLNYPQNDHYTVN